MPVTSYTDYYPTSSGVQEFPYMKIIFLMIHSFIAGHLCQLRHANALFVTEYPD